MARLTDQDAVRLVARLASGPLPKPALTVEPPQASAPTATIATGRQRLERVSADGSLGPPLTQRLASYLGKPVRCTSDDALRPSGDGPLYISSAGHTRVWLQMDALLASAFADAMIGGEGDAPKVGFGTRVARVAAGAATEMLRVIAAALELPQAARAELERDTREGLAASAGGSLSVATQDYRWRAGLLDAVSRGLPPAQELDTDRTRPLATATRQAAPWSEATGVDEALERARRHIQEMLGVEVVFDSFTVASLGRPRVPQGWLRVGLASRDGGAVVLAIDRHTAATLVNRALRADIVTPGESGTLVETGCEVIVRAALRAFADALGSTPDELHHIVLLSDDAILADLPHRSVEHRLACGPHTGVLRWLVPERMVEGAQALHLGREQR